VHLQVTEKRVHHVMSAEAMAKVRVRVRVRARVATCVPVFRVARWLTQITQSG